MIDALPPRELDRVEFERLRGHEAIVGVSGMGSHDAELTSGLLIGIRSGKIVALHLLGREQGWELVASGDLQDLEATRDVVEAFFASTDAQQEAVDAFYEKTAEWRDLL